MSRFEKHKMGDPRLPFIFHDHAFTKGRSSGNNWHENIELLCITEGNAMIVTDGQSILASPGDIAVVNANCIHSILATTDVHYYCLIIDRAFCLANYFDTSSIHFTPLVNNNELFTLINEFASAFRDKESPYRILTLRTLLLSISDLLCRRYSIASEKPHEDTQLLSAIKSVIGFIHSESHRPLTLDELAELGGMSKCYLSRTFHKITGYTVTEYINQTRCEKAKTLLTKDEMTIENIAHACGFSNVSYFIRTFCSFTGLRPGEYRAQFSTASTK